MRCGIHERTKKVNQGATDGPLFESLKKRFPVSLHLASIRHILEHMIRQQQEVIMQTERHVRLFKNGRNQAIRIPKDFEMPGDEAIIRKEGACLVIKPVKHPSLLALLATLRPLNEDFPDVDEELLPSEDIEL